MCRSRLIVFGAALIGIGLAGAILILVVISSDPTRFAEKVATYALKRPVSIGTAEFVPGNPFEIRLGDFRVANEPWGTQPDMIKIGKLYGTIQLLPLMTGKLKFDHLAVDDITVLLEHGPDGRGNWKKKNSSVATPSSEAERAQQSRAGMPTILDLGLHNSHIIFRTSGGATLKIDFDNLKLQTSGDDQPVVLTVAGAYNDNAVTMNIVTQSFDQLHNTEAPFGADVRAEGAATAVKLEAHMMDPLNFEQVDGRLDVHVKNVGVMTGLFGSPSDWDIPLHFQSILKHDEGVWNFNDAAGDIAGNIFAHSQFSLVEGKPKTPDRITAELDFKNFDIASVMGKSKKTANPDDNILNFLNVGDNPSSLVKATIKSDEIKYGHFQSSKFELDASIAPNSVALNHISTVVSDGAVSASLISTTTKKKSEIRAEVQASNLNSKQFLAALGKDNQVIDGNIDVDVALTAQSKSLAELKKTAEGTAAMSMVGGYISRHMMRMASADLKSLFDNTEPRSNISCAIAVLHFTNGIGFLNPFQIRTDAGTLNGSGHVNLWANSADLKLQTDPHTTSFIALDLPVQVKGDLDSPSFSPVLTGKKLVDQASYPAFHFSQVNFARTNPCYAPTSLKTDSPK